MKDTTTITLGHAAAYPAPMLPETPDCGAPCAICEAHAHNASRLQALCDRQAATIGRLRAVLTDMQFAGHVGYVRNLATKTLEETL